MAWIMCVWPLHLCSVSVFWVHYNLLVSKHVDLFIEGCRMFPERSLVLCYGSLILSQHLGSSHILETRVYKNPILWFVLGFKKLKAKFRIWVGAIWSSIILFWVSVYVRLILNNPSLSLSLSVVAHTPFHEGSFIVSIKSSLLTVLARFVTWIGSFQILFGRMMLNILAWMLSWQKYFCT